ncbi:MAG: electron transport complex subunit RsxE [Spirochaetaceae bacterium]|nr:electron transport complex subunit RsxE [Spirochaetaceae bacterium]
MIKELTKGVFKENAIFVMGIGLCPTLGVSTKVVNALGMGAGVIFVLICSNIMISLLKDFIPNKVRIPAYIVVIASFTAVVEMVMQAYTPGLFRTLGVFVPLIAVNCVIFARAEVFAGKHTILPSILDALGAGIGFTLGLLVIALIREVLGSGTITLFPLGSFEGVIDIPVLINSPVRIVGLSAGALFVIGFLQAFLNWYIAKKKEVK